MISACSGKESAGISEPVPYRTHLADVISFRITAQPVHMWKCAPVDMDCDMSVEGTSHQNPRSVCVAVVPPS